MRIIGRFGALDGLEIGHMENVTFTEAMEYATETLDAFMSEVMPTN